MTIDDDDAANDNEDDGDEGDYGSGGSWCDGTCSCDGGEAVCGACVGLGLVLIGHVSA